MQATTSMHQETFERRLPTALALVVAAWIPHLPTLGTAFLADTHALILQVWDAGMHDPLAFFTVNLGGGFRPLTCLSVFATAWLVEGDEAVHRGLELLIHSATTLVVWRIGRSLGLTPPRAIAGALLFAWSPCASVAVPWIAARPDVTAGLTSGLAFLAYAADRNRPTRASLARLYGACLLMVMSKEVVILLPVVMWLLGGGRRRYLPLLLLTATLVVIRIHFHSMYSEDTQREYSPLTPLREPERLPRILGGGGNVAFSMLTCTAGPHLLASQSWSALTAVLGWLLAVALAASTWRRVPLALAFAAALMLPNFPFLGKGLDGYRTYSSGAFALPLLVLALSRLGRPGRIVPFLLLVPSLLGAFQNTRIWIRASDRFRDTLERLEPHRRSIEAEWRKTGRPMGVEVLGLPQSEGYIPLFPAQEGYAISTLTAPWFPYYRSTDPTDPKYRQRVELGWYAAEGPEELKDWLRSQGYAVRTIDLRE